MTLYSRAETNAQSLKVLNTTEKNSVDKYDWDNTLITDGNSVVAGAQGYTTAARRSVYIDEVEATLKENRERGLNAPGWWEYMTYTDGSGATRHKAQHLVSMGSAPANTADLDDNIAADVASAITVGTLADVSVEEGNIVTFDAAAVSTTTSGTLVYVWQRRTSSTGRWANVTASLDGGIYDTTSTNGELTIEALDVTLDLNGYEFRVKVTNTVGGEEVVSNVAELEVTETP